MQITMATLGAAAITPTALLVPARDRAEVEVLYVAARDRERAETFAKKHEIPHALDNYDELVAAPVDAIYNPLPPVLHAEWTIRALKAGKHVLCEKPFALSAGEAARMVAAAAAADRVLMEAFHYRYHPLFARVLEHVGSGVLGRIVSLDAEFTVAIRNRENFRWQRRSGGGATMDLGCYAIHSVRTVMGSEPIVAHAEATDAGDGVDATMTADLRFPNDVRARVHCSMADDAPFSSRLSIRGRDGSLEVTNPVVPHQGNCLRLETNEGVLTEEIKGESTYHYQLDAFLGAIAGNDSAAPTRGCDAIGNMKTIDAIYAAAGLPARNA